MYGMLLLCKLYCVSFWHGVCTDVMCVPGRDGRTDGGGIDARLGVAGGGARRRDSLL